MSENIQPVSIPSEGESPDNILQQIRMMKQEDVAWKEGRVWSLVYYANEEHDNLLKAASSELFSANYLNPLAFKSLHRMEQEVVHMTARMLHGDENTVGVMTTGGTESILLAMFCHRQRARELHPHITRPEVVAPVTIHPAFDKAAILFGLHIRKAPVDENRSAIPGAMEQLINENTILIAVSAPSYPNGVLDPVETVAGIGKRHHLPVHVDACVGGFMLPWVEKLGHAVPPWDFRVSGVCSVSADVHKFGYGAKGASVLLYKNMDYLRHQFVVTTDFPGGIYISPTLLGTRAGGPIAAAWAGMKHLGETGYLSIAKKMMEGAQKLRAGLAAMPGINIVGNPCMNIISYTTRNNDPDIFVIADQLEAKGWMIDRQQFPNCIHLTVLPTNVDVIDQYLSDLKAALAFATEHPGATAKGNAAIYGLMARIPFRGMVEKSVKKIMEDMYKGDGTKELDAKEKSGNAITKSPAWLGMLNRLLAAWAKRKKKGNNTLLSLLFVCCVIFQAEEVWSQPLIDPFQVRYTYAFRSNNTAATPFVHFWAGSDLPIKLKGSTYLLLSPYYEQWRIDSADKKEIYPAVQSLALPIGLILPFHESKWAITVLPIVRWNGEKLFDGNTFQYGAITFATYARKPNQKFRLGVYANAEFFGLFVWPLLGTDWRIDARNNLFGLLPGRLTYEHKWNKKFYGGVTFRALTNSYRFSNGQYIRLDDNQISLYMDYYPAKNICLTLEPGYGVYRKIRTGINKGEYLTNFKWGDGPFIKLSAAYRLRL
ncbi:pyridoxal phosphate-dependent decarboxylase family protein [Flavihumibacter profundi]|uniref:pyridoxal phosphate-dependent decarboxylase family protein n=1 Tax=Flavihumibacter profundi TaxID=2716883 RepID=UPI001CC3DF64|nr:aspartate aminotransferase family protein [Flavihumibacter profundi]MBZ5856815.1 aspartate aminotransferase family protein [Flavihumibacter profundi]